MKNKLIKGTPEWEAYWRPIIEKRKKTCIEKYGYFTAFSNSDTQAKVRDTMFKKYGVDNIFKLPEKQKEMLEQKIKNYNGDLSAIYKKQVKTLNERYSVDNVSQIEKVKQKKKILAQIKYGVDNVFQSEEIKNRIKNSILNKYGVEYISQSLEFKEKQKQSNKEKYGFEFTSQVPEIHNKMETTLIKNGGIGNARVTTFQKYKNTSLERYGVEFATQLQEIKNKIKETCLQKYGVQWHCLSKDCKLTSNNSKPNSLFAELLKAHNIIHEREFYLDGRSYDFKVGDYLIEINPWYTHNSSLKTRWGNLLDKNYHFIKSKIASKNGYRCIHVFDWVDKNIILNHIKDNTLNVSNFRDIKCYRYNIKTKEVLEGDLIEDNEVLIYDGGQDLIW